MHCQAAQYTRRHPLHLAKIYRASCPASLIKNLKIGEVVFLSAMSVSHLEVENSCAMALTHFSGFGWPH